MKYIVKVKESQVATYLVECEGEYSCMTLGKDAIFSNGTIIDTLDCGDGNVTTEEVLNCKAKQ